LCGIVGYTHKYWLPDPGRIRRATDILIHRGPDQQGVYQSEVFSMGSTRLKILDLEFGDQPMVAEEADTTICFNGEVYNHREVRDELERRGHRFRSHCDTETVLRAFLEWDTGCFSRLRGMFAIALWTGRSRRLVLARDRVGIKPLYISRQAGDLFFGSELKAILIHPEIPRQLSLDGLACYLSLNYVPSTWTLVEGIEKLRPGSWLEWRDGKVSTDSYWRLPSGATRPWTLDAAREELDSLLQQATREHLLSDVSLGVWLSGGIDSSTILHYAATQSSARLKTFSISFHGKSFDESTYIRQVVDQYGTEHEELDLNPECDLAGAIEQFAYYSDEPNADAGALPLWFLSKLTKTKATVALGGEGADELFGGYLTYPANRLASAVRRMPASALRFALRVLRYWPVSDEKISYEYKLKRFLEGCLLPPGRAHVHWNGTFADEESRGLVRMELPGAVDRLVEDLNGLESSKNNLEQYLWFDQKYYLPDNILTKADRISMAHAVEVRVPFLDHRLVEFAGSLPASLKIRGSRQKFLLKELMKRHLPPTVTARSKIGFDIPAHEWLRGPLRDFLVDTLRAGAAQHGDLFRFDVIEMFLARHLKREANLGYHLWGLMLLFLWMKTWKIQATPALAAEQSLPEKAGSCI